MKNIEDCWGEKLSQILVKPNTDYFSPTGEILLDEIVFVFEKSKLHILPISDTDEISVKCLEYDNAENATSFIATSVFNEYVGKSLSITWNCVNANGYFDLYVIGFAELHPSVMILSEGGVLKLFNAKRAK